MEKTRLSGHGWADRLGRRKVFRYPRFIREGPWLKKVAMKQAAEEEGLATDGRGLTRMETFQGLVLFICVHLRNLWIPSHSLALKLDFAKKSKRA